MFESSSLFLCCQIVSNCIAHRRHIDSMQCRQSDNSVRLTSFCFQIDKRIFVATDHQICRQVFPVCIAIQNSALIILCLNYDRKAIECCYDFKLDRILVHDSAFVTNNSNNVCCTFNSSTLISACGGRLSGLSGSFSAPQYPLKDARSLSCIWHIAVAEGCQITVFFKINFKY